MIGTMQRAGDLEKVTPFKHGYNLRHLSHRIHGTGIFTQPFPIECGQFSPFM